MARNPSKISFGNSVPSSSGSDVYTFNISNVRPVSGNLGGGHDFVNVQARDTVQQVRVTFTSSEVGNGSARDSDTMANQDGGLAVRLQTEYNSGSLKGPVSRFDDEGIVFRSNGKFTFDVRDLVSGVQRGDTFDVVELGTRGSDSLVGSTKGKAYYLNGGMGNDRLTGGFENDFLVGGAGNDTFVDRAGNDSFIGGAGNDVISGGSGDDTAIFAVATDGSDRTDLGTGLDTVNVAAPVTATQVRLTFTSAEVGNDNARDSNTLANQDGGLAVRLQAEDGSGGLTGLVSRFDDEGITFVSTVAGVTFDVRDLVSGVARGDQFSVVRLGTNADDTFNETGKSVAYYINAGMGDDSVTGGSGNDFLVGGAGNDTLNGLAGNDSFIGGGGNDTITGDIGDDLAIFTVATDGSDTVDLGAGLDTVNVAAPVTATQVRLTFTSAEVGNGNALDSNTLANQDGGLAVRLQAEDGLGGLTGLVSRYDDEGISFVSTVAGVTFDVRDLVSGVARGDQFNVVRLGTGGNDTFNETGSALATYINAGAGNDNVTGGSANDFLVGGAGNDTINGLGGNDSFIGGGGSDVFVFAVAPGNDTINDFVSGTDKIDLRALNIDFSDITTTTVGTNTLVNVDTNNDSIADFNITLVNVTAPSQSDYLFA